MTTDSGAGPVGSGSEGEVAGAGGLPAGWVRATIGELCDVNPRGFDEEPGDDEFVSQVPMASVEAETGRMDASTQVRYGDFKKKSLTRFQEDDVVFAKITPCMENGKIAKARGLAGGRALGSTEFHVLRSRGAVLPEYLMHFLLQRHVRRVAEHHMTGAVGQRRVPRPYLAELEIPVPPLAEQHRIVAKLDEQLANIETGEGSLADAEARIVTFVASLLAEVIKPSEGWETKTIGEMAAVSSGATPLKGRSDYYDGGTVSWITSSLLNAPFVERADKFITEKAVAETAVKEYPPGTLLLAMYGEGKTRGKCSELRIHATTNQACAGIQIAAEYECRKDWVKLVLEARYEENRALASGGVQPNLSLGLVKKIQVPLPPLMRQKELLEQVAQRRADAGKMFDVIESVKIQAAELRNALLHAAFTGALVPQDPDDEPASILLDRIRAERTAIVKQTRRKRASRTTSPAAPQTSGRPVPSGTQEALPL
ncbi:type I restriction enzyme S subunit [Streptomyces luteogriseus]|uniref:restriction endonuclease subunit S n=1 Tax=Streptomyces luteogriseus TaxID=68233 RepID=UPI002788ACB1|nr:restriction endonuclease subunit S [Streptomyces luteogriseus]MDQ0712421.1 type I restriction enzyme S subunit [Streptomyces luteogriseus]